MPTKASITTRTGKASPLLTSEMDGNLEALRDQSIGFADDTSTVLDVDSGNTITIAGAGTVSTALSGSTLTVTGSGITASSTDTLTNKTIDANGTGNAISNLEVADFAGSAIITVSETLAANDSDTALVTAGAIIDYVDAQDANIASDTLTFTNKTFDANGTGNSITNIEVADLASGVLDTDLASVSASDDTLASAKAIKAYVDASGGGISNIVEDTTPQLGGNLDVNGNQIVSVSNADININPDGTGAVIIGGDLHIGGDTETLITTSTGNVLVLNGGTNGWTVVGDATDANFNSNFSTSTIYHHGALQYSENLSVTPGTTGRLYANTTLHNVKLDGTNSSDSNDRYRNQQLVKVDLNSSEITATGAGRGVQNFIGVELDNTSATAGRVSETKAIVADMYFNPSTGDITADEVTGVLVTGVVEGSNAADITSSYGFKFSGVDYSGGNGTITNEYGFYYGDLGNASNNYAFYSENDNAKSRLGRIERYRENIVTLTDDSTADVTVDFNTSQIHTYSLNDAKEFRFDNIPTGGTCTLIITNQGAHTATFINGADSTAIKFPGGAPTVTSGAGKIDVVTVFNDGTNLLGNIAQDFS